MNPEHGNGHGDREFEIIARGGKGQRGRLAVGSADLFTHEKRDEKHHDKINEKWYCDPNHIKWDFYDVFTFHGKHDNDCK